MHHPHAVLDIICFFLICTSNSDIAAGVTPDILSRLQEWLPADRLLDWAGEHAFVQVPLLLVAIFFVRGVFQYFGRYLAIKSGASLIRDLRSELYGSIAHQSLPFFQVHPRTAEGLIGLWQEPWIDSAERGEHVCTEDRAGVISGLQPQASSSSTRLTTCPRAKRVVISSPGARVEASRTTWPSVLRWVTL